jgi:transmembrane sensor
MTLEAQNGTPSVIDIAAEWFARRRSGAMSLQEACELEAWLESAMANHEAFLSVCRTWTTMQSVAIDPEMLSMREATVARTTFHQRMRIVSAGAAMTAVLVTALYAFGIGSLWRDWTAPVTDQRFQTAIGETITLSLADGSSVTLDSNTVVAAHETWRERDISLLRGQAFFHVAKDSSRPFVVSAAGSQVTATGTAFNVRIDPDRLTVVLTEGRLHVLIAETESAPPQQSDMAAGWQLIAASSGERTLTRVNSDAQARALSWTTRQLTFVQQPLSAVAAELNRYSLKKIVIAPDLASVPIDGVFRAGDIDGFVRLLIRGRLVRVQNDTDSTITLALFKKTRPGSRPRVHDF